jgi:hypothetical protein
VNIRTACTAQGFFIALGSSFLLEIVAVSGQSPVALPELVIVGFTAHEMASKDDRPLRLETSEILVEKDITHHVV